MSPVIKLPSYKIIDNFLPEAQFNEFVEEAKAAPWYAQENIVRAGDGEYDMLFTHILYIDFERRSELMRFLYPILEEVKAKSLIRSKLNLYPRTHTLVKHGMHTDYPFPHEALLFYLNTNDGVTTLEDGTEIESVANRLLMFDASKPHSSSSCTNQKYRLNLNVNYF
jgi:hypothetical protein